MVYMNWGGFGVEAKDHAGVSLVPQPAVCGLFIGTVVSLCGACPLAPLPPPQVLVTSIIIVSLLQHIVLVILGYKCLILVLQLLQPRLLIIKITCPASLEEYIIVSVGLLLKLEIPFFLSCQLLFESGDLLF